MLARWRGGRDRLLGRRLRVWVAAFMYENALAESTSQDSLADVRGSQSPHLSLISA